ncbi:hypothetical protein [Streptomyces erythrochromogenes]|uniref:hypothetical protein n=1 Tax=Streptomyces erythrochromogenes TaxID=285574 RepID=UPI003F4DBDA6
MMKGTGRMMLMSPDPDAVGVPSADAAAGHEEREDGGGGSGDQGTPTRQCRNHCVIHVQTKSQIRDGWIVDRIPLLAFESEVLFMNVQ